MPNELEVLKVNCLIEKPLTNEHWTRHTIAFTNQVLLKANSFYRAPILLRPRTTPTPIMCPTDPQAKVSARVKPAGSPVCNPESLISSFSPAVDFLFADGANPNLPANNIRLVLVIIICENNISVYQNQSPCTTGSICQYKN